MIEKSAPRGWYPTLVFVTHGGPLEAKSALLAASLAQYYLPGRIATRLIYPVEIFGEISDATAKLFSELKIEVLEGTNEIDAEYKHGNKITSLSGIHRPCVFLDSDMLLMCPFSWHYSFNADASVKPADLDTFGGGGGSWAQVWKLFDRKLPAKTYVASLSNEAICPYFNAGFIYACDGHQLSEAWLEAAKRIDASPKVENKRPWLDQVALPIAFSLLNWDVRELDVAFNFPNHLAQMAEGLPYVAHYHWPKVIANDPHLLRRTFDLFDKHPLLLDIMRPYDEWACVTSRYHQSLGLDAR